MYARDNPADFETFMEVTIGKAPQMKVKLTNLMLQFLSNSPEKFENEKVKSLFTYFLALISLFSLIYCTRLGFVDGYQPPHMGRKRCK